PASLRWIAYSHFEPDESGALNDFLALAPRAQAVSSVVGVAVMLDDYADRAARALADGEVLATGRHRLRFLSTPHVPHCSRTAVARGGAPAPPLDGGARVPFAPDLFSPPAAPAPLTRSALVAPAGTAAKEGAQGPLANDMPWTPYTETTLERLAALEPRTL